MLSVEQWAEIRRLHFVGGLSIREVARRTGRDRKTIRRALRSSEPPRYRRAPRPSKLDPFKEEVHRLLRAEPRLPGMRLRELLAELGYDGGQTILDNYLREMRPLFLPTRTYQRTVYRPGELCQFDLWEPSLEIPVGYGQTRRGYVVVACLGYSRAGASSLVFSKEAPDLLYGMGRCLALLGGLPETLVWDREGALHAGEGRPSEAFAAFCGQLRVGWRFCAPADPEAKGAVERLQRFLETSFEPGRRFCNELDYQEQLDRWFAERANARVHRTLRCRPVDRLAEEQARMRSLPEKPPNVDRRFVLRVPPDPYLRFDTCDYSLDPRLVGRRVEREVRAACLDTGELACHHRRTFARHRTLTALEHARALRERRGQLDFLEAKENVVLLGPPGTGKTHLAIALSIRACLAGHRVHFATATEWVARLGDAQRSGRLSEELRRLLWIPLLVVDEVGYIPFDPQAANLMFMLVSSRYERASLIVTSNKPFSGWGEIFGDEVVAAAMIDRLVHHAEILSLKGDSYRLKDKDLGARPQPRE